VVAAHWILVLLPHHQDLRLTWEPFKGLGEHNDITN
jgi:hypothetical protein